MDYAEDEQGVVLKPEEHEMLLESTFHGDAAEVG
jgi:hypothetical protein